MQVHYEDTINLLRASYEVRIHELNSRIEDFHKLVFPSQIKEISKEALEADAIISVSEKSPEMSEEELNKLLEGERELDLVLSGNFDTELLN